MWERTNATRRLRAMGGFTLVELLVCIAVIALLVALVAAALAGSKRAARAAVCLSNLRQLSAAWSVYTTDYGCWPLSDDPQPWRGVFYGWGGVHWFGPNDTPVPFIPIPRDRPLNSYLGLSGLLESDWRGFRCPSDTGTFRAGSGVRPWDGAAQASLCDDRDRLSAYGVVGTSYEANEWAYCRMGAVDGMGYAPLTVAPPNFRNKQGPDAVGVAPSRFVLLGDIGAMSGGRISRALRQQRDVMTAWWHAPESGQLGFLDGSARLEKMGRVTTSRYVFYLDPTRQPLGSRTFAFTW